MCAALGDEILILTLCEAIADYLSEKRPAEAARLYRVAANVLIFEVTQATGSGEGISAINALRRVESKLKSLNVKKSLLSE